MKEIAVEEVMRIQGDIIMGCVMKIYLATLRLHRG